jgi:hypothetical protein
MGTHTVYDALGRVTRTERLSTIQNAIITVNGVSSSQLVTAGAVVVLPEMIDTFSA